MEGCSNCLEPIKKKYSDEKVMFWVNLRQEPVVYVNGKPYSAREPDKLNSHIEVGDMEELHKMEAAFTKEIEDRGAEFKYYQDQYGEHPDERKVKNVELNEKITKVQTVTQVIDGLKEQVRKKTIG